MPSAPYLQNTMATLIKSYAKLSDSELNTKSQSVVTSLTDNTYFPTTSPTLAEFGLVQTAYAEALINSAGRDRTNVAIKNQARTNLLSSMKFLAVNIEDLAKGDRVKLVSSGFDLSSSGEGSTVLSPPENFTVTDGPNKGELKLSIKGDSKALAYFFEHTEEPLTENSKWSSRTSSVREHTITGLRSGIRTYVRAGKVGRKSKEVYSEILSRIVQ